MPFNQVLAVPNLPTFFPVRLLAQQSITAVALTQNSNFNYQLSCTSPNVISNWKGYHRLRLAEKALQPLRQILEPSFK